MSANRRLEQGPTVDPDHSPAHSGLFVTHDSSTVTRGHAQSGSMGTSAAAARRGHAPPRSARFPPSRDEHVCWPRSPQGHAFCALVPRAGAALASPRGRLRPQPTKGACEPAWAQLGEEVPVRPTYVRTHARTYARRRRQPHLQKGEESARPVALVVQNLPPNSHWFPRRRKRHCAVTVFFFFFSFLKLNYVLVCFGFSLRRKSLQFSFFHLI